MSNKIAIYCLMQGEEVVYIGQTNCPSIRIYEHKKGLHRKEFDDYFVRWVDVEEANTFEQKAIEYYQPKYNSEGVKRAYVPYRRSVKKVGSDAND